MLICQVLAAYSGVIVQIIRKMLAGTPHIRIKAVSHDFFWMKLGYILSLNKTRAPDNKRGKSFHEAIVVSLHYIHSVAGKCPGPGRLSTGWHLARPMATGQRGAGYGGHSHELGW